MVQGLAERPVEGEPLPQSYPHGKAAEGCLAAGVRQDMRQEGTGVLPVARILKGIRAAVAEKGGEEMMQERLIRPREVANRLAVSRSTVYRWFWEGKLKGVKITGGTVRILESAVRDKMAEVY